MRTVRLNLDTSSKLTEAVESGLAMAAKRTANGSDMDITVIQFQLIILEAKRALRKGFL
jgi:hypothetical protein